MAILMMTIYVKNSKNHILGEFVKYLEMYPSNNVCDSEFREISKLPSLNIIEKIIGFTLYMISQIFQ